MNFELVKCDRCGTPSSGYYTLSSLTKGMYVQCVKCGNHAAPYAPGLKLRWKPSKTFIREVGAEEAAKRAHALERGIGIAPQMAKTVSSDEEVVSASLSQPTFYCDAGTKNNGQFGNQKTVVVVTNAAGKVIVEEWIGDKTNNEGELTAIIRAAGKIPRGALILSDSDLAVKWVQGKYRTKVERLKPLIYDATTAVTSKDIKVRWIPREENLAGHYIEKKYSL
jgi:ribonuclease HI